MLINKPILRICLFGILSGGLFAFFPLLISAQEASTPAATSTAPVIAPTSADMTLKEIQDELGERKDRIDKLKKDISRYQESIVRKQREAVSLVTQINILNEEIRKMELQLELIDQQTKSTKLEITETQKEIERTQNLIQEKKAQIAQLVRILNRLDRQDMAIVVMKHQSISDFFIYQGVATRIGKRVHEHLNSLKEDEKILERTQAALANKKRALEQYAKEVKDKTAVLEGTRLVRSQILVSTKNSEDQFRLSVQELKAEQNSINADIVTLEKHIREKIESGGLKKLKELGSSTFIWPVPQNTVTAYFHDPSYPYRHVFEHPAVDIRASQGTPVRAAAPGFVARAKDGVLGYSYIMLVHNDGISTVYGHVSRISVEEDEFVNQGDIIGFSGGLPGTPGAGRFTTGAHLHFEVRVNGLPTDPLEYLP